MLLTGRHPIAGAFPYMRRFFGILPTPPRCRWCNAPFEGAAAPLMRAIGHARFDRNPNYCVGCYRQLLKRVGGIELEFSMLFADVRGSTPMAERLGAKAFRTVMNRFYATGTNVLTDADAVVERFQGDQVVGYFLPILTAGRDAQHALGAARELLRQVGYGSASEPWIHVGIGLNRDTAFFGTIGDEHGMVELAAVGDAVNTTARLASSAGPGEILMTERAFAAIDDNTTPSEQRHLELKGKAEPVDVRVLRVA